VKSSQTRGPEQRTLTSLLSIKISTSVSLQSLYFSIVLSLTLRRYLSGIALLAGGTDGYWLDSLDNKPWRNSDDRQQAMSRFWNWVNVWAPSWPSGDKIRERGMAIDSVKMYQKC